MTYTIYYCLLNEKNKRSKHLVLRPGVRKKPFGYQVALSRNTTSRKVSFLCNIRRKEA